MHLQPAFIGLNIARSPEGEPIRFHETMNRLGNRHFRENEMTLAPAIWLASGGLQIHSMEEFCLNWPIGRETRLGYR
ncbi:hypothetical protein ACT6QG_11350 [Xanthobacter sp. TB0136]|uniref:hypothetical protein n=1 Tax=Xanthobacter sp. TB0136 TaxID=3459177 RepID=UPI00403A067F